MARSRGTWTTEQARQNAAKGGQACKFRRELRAKLREQERLNSPNGNAAPAVLVPLDPPSFDFEGLSLNRVRAHLHNLHQVISTEETKKRPDAQRLHWLCKSLAELSELERRLAGRPLPGSRRPAPEPSPGRVPRTLAPPAARPAPRADSPSPSPAADDLDDDPPLQSAPLD